MILYHPRSLQHVESYVAVPQSGQLFTGGSTLSVTEIATWTAPRDIVPQSSPLSSIVVTGGVVSSSSHEAAIVK